MARCSCDIVFHRVVASLVVVNVSLSCYVEGVVYYQVCLTVGTEPADVLNGTYTTYEFYFARMCQSKFRGKGERKGEREGGKEGRE